MTNNDELAIKLKAAAEMATPGEWERGDGKHGGELLVYCDDALGSAVCEATNTYNSMTKLQRISNLTFIATANPANILSLLAEREGDKALIVALKESMEKSREQSSKWLEAYHKAVSIGARYEERIAELESLTAEQDKRLITYAAIATKNASEARTVSVKWPDDGMDDCYDLWGAEQCRNNFDCGYNFSAVRHEQAIREALAAAGIKLEVGE